MIGYKWDFAVKVNPCGSIVWLKAYLVVKGYTQTYGGDYSILVANLIYVRLFISLDTTHTWPLYKLDIKKKKMSS